MEKYLNKIVLSVLIQLFIGGLYAQEGKLLSGKVRSATDRQVLPGANVLIKGTLEGTVTDTEGIFSLSVASDSMTLMVSYLGFISQEKLVIPGSGNPLVFYLEPDQVILAEVEVLSTGYQEMPRERASGSFVQLGQEMVDRRVSTNILDRLQDITPGLIFNRSNESQDPISIRGRSSIFANTMPLVIVDNFPYDGPLENINPNDVASFTILRDAAAASIWGARAGNGVIVITTKNGTAGQAPRVSFNSNVILSEKPDLFYAPIMENEDFVEVERMLFDRGYYKNSENSSSKTPLSPLVETLIAQRDGVISSDEAEKRVAGYKTHDVRSELQNIYYRPRLSQQYSLGIAGGGTQNNYAVSAGYDRTDENVVGNSRERITLNAKNFWLFLKDKLDANLGLYFTGSGVSTATELPSPYSYDYLLDANGNPLPITRGYSRRYIEGDLPAGLLDWNYVPLDELGTMENTSRSSDLRVNVGLGYKIFPGLRASISHQYWQNTSSQRNYQLVSSYFVRDLINQFSQLNPDGSITKPIPEGGIEDIGSNVGLSHNFRAQLNYDKVFGKNQLTVLSGYEAKSLRSEGSSTRFYGYEEELGVSRQVDYITRFRRFHNNSLASIPSVDAHSGTVDNFISGYFNSSFTFDKKLVFNASMRRDASNLFGVRTNQKAIPLWSAGASWVLSEESFLAGWNLPFIRLRTTYGYNGNVDRSVSAFTTAQYVSGGPFSLIPSLPYAVVSSPANPDLRWERIGILNFGVDVETTDGRLRTSLEYYVKRGTDLLGDFPVAPSTGLRQFRGNFANTLTKGFDFEISTLNTQGQIKWDTRLFVSYVNEKVTDYEREFSATSALLGTSGAVPLPGKPLFSILSIPFAGLDPANGNPLGYLDGEASDDYSAIISSLTVGDLQYHGPSRPKVFGAVTNNLSWKNLSLSFNITYRMGYYYRRQTVNYGDLLAGRISHSDYALRWVKPGDEAVTDVPSMPEANNNNRNTLTLYGSNLVEKGDHIRLQDIRLSYQLNQSEVTWWPFQQTEFYSYADNLGIIWKASDDRLDPDFRTARPARSISFGMRIGF